MPKLYFREFPTHLKPKNPSPVPDLYLVLCETDEDAIDDIDTGEISKTVATRDSMCSRDQTPIVMVECEKRSKTKTNLVSNIIQFSEYLTYKLSYFKYNL